MQGHRHHTRTSDIRRQTLTTWISVFFFHDAATTAIYTLSLHDALPIYAQPRRAPMGAVRASVGPVGRPAHEHLPRPGLDRKSTRLNSSHPSISYAVFCLKKKKPPHTPPSPPPYLGSALRDFPSLVPCRV